ncbi:Rho GTPase [Apophysomyces sp. BC1034]|nr:Rho GTPase [Apophysomyces sp. BC1015]KAG0177520.1 Rho GTPase [Apophysomyces sp. BC1021]KAG0187819.1 Rho GTPase [Apophysomyces sp. BC1034]
MTVDGHEIELSLWDVAGQEESDRVRILSYDNTHVVMLCFCVDDRDSLENVVHQWLDEVTNHCPDAKLILVALKCDLRDDPVVRRHRGNPVMYEEGLAIARSINAACYLECSAMHNRGVHECFEQACRVAMTVKLRASPDHSRFKECIIL